MAKSNEPIFWSLFAAGGAVAAMLVPIHILVLGLMIPFSMGDSIQANDLHKHLLTLVTHPIGKLYLFVLISLPLFHWAHRFHFTLADIGLKAIHKPIAFLSYAAAVAGTIWCVMTLWSL